MGSFGLWLARGARRTNSSGADSFTDTPPSSKVGVGLIMAADESSGCIYISDLVPDSAAWHSTLCVGDRITHIDGVSVRGKLAVAVNDLLLGVDGTMVELRIEARALTEGPKVPPAHIPRVNRYHRSSFTLVAP